MPDYTVNLAGPERHDGEKGYTYVVTADSPDEAWEKVYNEYVSERYLPGEKTDVLRLGVEEGVPGPGVWYHWNDLREPKPFHTAGSLRAALAGAADDTPIVFDFLPEDGRKTKLVVSAVHPTRNGVVFVVNEEPDEE